MANAWESLSSRLEKVLFTDHHEALIITALKLALASLRNAGVMREDGRGRMERCIELGATLARLSYEGGVPLDAETVAAGIVLEAVEQGGLDVGAVHARLGPGVASLVHDVMRVRSAPERVELYDDEASR